MKKIIGFTSALLLFPVFAFAATPVDTTGLEQTVAGLIRVVNLLIPFFLAIAVIVFIYGLIKYVLNAGDAAKRTEGRGYMIYGIIAIAIILSIFGLVKLLQNTFGIQNNIITDIPQVPSN